jgi:hypothetical protein
MRAGPLADADVIASLNRYYVPVYVSNEDYEKDGPAPAAEKAERNRVWSDALKAGKPSGTVHVYLLDGDGKLLDSMHVAEAAKPGKLLAMLKATAGDQKVLGGKPVVAPTCQSSHPDCADGDVVLHLTARGTGRGSWREFPSENWIVLDKEARKSLLPPEGAAEGTTWDVSKEAAARVLTYFYPQTENNDVSKNRIDDAALQATVVSVKDGVLRARLDGLLKMKHTFYPHKDDDNRVDASVVGYVDVDLGKQRVKSLRLVTDKATYAGEKFDVAARLEP